jgi:integrase
MPESNKDKSMAINLCCPVCYKAYKLGTITCNCGNNLKQHKLFKVRIKHPNGKWRSKQVTTLELAKKIEAKFRTESIESDIFNINKAYVIDVAWKRYLQWAKLNKRSWIDDKIRWDRHISKYLKNKKMDRITPNNIQTILNDMAIKLTPQGNHYAPATIKQVLVLIKRVYNWSIEQKLYQGHNPCTSLAIPQFDNKVTNPLNKKALESLLNVLNSWINIRAVLVVKFALYTGKRKGEILKLTWDCVDLQNNYLYFKASNTKNKKSSTIPINKNCIEILRKCQEIKLSDLVFPSNAGNYYSTFDETWKRIRKKAGLSIRFHDLRHTYASYLASSGKVDIYTLKELLGHSSIEMTQRYAHLVNGALKRAVDIVDEVF